ncbi:sulfite exporter TauE/SafE family protein [Cryobacterium frigoriphilum]|uniref:sulfite exporter TauE/SafE family protein n=1 Tax=Cryobacterium frigoriphilum TaxID=1259150 RepID=UPI001F54439C|nr:sulfite exporter TauE/SafE family protein [Cryobacterium frigoriphilum]
MDRAFRTGGAAVPAPDSGHTDGAGDRDESSIDVWTIVLVLVAVLVGSSMQRVTGMGFALVAAPFLVLLLGPIEGIVLINACAVLTASVILARVVRDVDWRRYGVLAAWALVGIIPGALVLRVVSLAWLEISIGVMVAVGLTVSLCLGRVALVDRPIYKVIAGILAGFMNTTAGVGGPAASIYAVATHWSQRSFAATMQPFFLTLGAASLIAKFVTGAAITPNLSGSVLLLIAAACLAGLVIGELLSRVIEPHIARRMLIVVAFVGSAATVVRGLTLL